MTFCDLLFKCTCTVQFYCLRSLWMERMEDEENDESDDLNDDSDIDDVSEDEGYNTSPEVDFEQFDYWALGLNSHLWRIDLCKECNDGF